MLDEVRDDGGTQRFGAGLPQTGLRSLSADEREWLRARLRGFHRGALAWAALTVAAAASAPAIGRTLDPLVVERLAGGPGIFVLALGCLGSVAALLRGHGGWRTVTAVPVVALLVGLAQPQVFPGLPPLAPSVGKALFLALVLVGSAFLVSRGRPCLRVLMRLAALRHDLRGGVVHCFEGATESQTGDEVLRELRAQHVIDDHRLDDSGKPRHRLELLPRSGLVVAADGKTPLRLCAAFITEVAASVPHAFRVRLPRNVEVDDEAIDVRRRSLTLAERAELDKHIKRLRRRVGPPILATVMLAALLGFDYLRGEQGGQNERSLLVVTLAWVALAIWTYFGYARRLFVAHKLDSDRQLQWVVTVEDAAANSSEVAAPPKLEVLPISQLAWTERARPAFWRRSEF